MFRNTALQLALATALILAPGAVRNASGQAQQRQPTPNDTLVSTEFSADHRVTFRIYAPKAAQVTVGGDWRGGAASLQMTKDDQGVWSVTSDPLVPDVYLYSFDVDGLRVMDQKNPTIKLGVTGMSNYLLVPGKESDFEANRPVPHGEVRVVWYQSSTLDGQRSMRVYTPPGYETGNQRYPVFYLLHGGGDEDSGWSTIGRAGFIIDNLLAEKKAKPMIVVMPNGNMPRQPAAGAGAPAAAGAAQDQFADELLKNVIPAVEKTFRTVAKPEARAIAGLSMGGGQTIRTAFMNPGTFGYVAIWSSGANTAATADFEKRYASFFNAPAKINQQWKLLSVSVGSKDPLANASAKNLVELLKAHKIEHKFHESDGAHTWINWRHYLNEYAPLLFR
jgi:enterochelin esterase-like enzyme